MTDFISLSHDGFISTLTIDRAEVRNAMSTQVIKQLKLAISDVHKDDKLRALIITGAGDKAFSAGADLKERREMSEPETLAFVRAIQGCFQQIAELPMPVIAAINGDAFGGGLELALACDIRVIAKTATIGLVETSLGIIPGAGGTQRLPRIVGLSAAMDLIFTSRRLGAMEALSLGLVNYVADDAEATRRESFALATRIANNAPLAIRAAKEALVASADLGIPEGLVTELASYHEILESEDRREGLKAFQEKRLPQFRGA